MSTKTTFKRVALVAVAALGLGVLSVAPSNAAASAPTVTVTAGSASVTKGASNESVTAATVTVVGLLTGVSDSYTVQLVRKSGPAASSGVGFVIAMMETTTSATTVVARTAAGTDISLNGANRSVLNFDTQTATSAGIYHVGSAGIGYAGAKFGLMLESTTGSTRVAGTYVYTAIVTPIDAGTARAAGIVTADLTFTVSDTAANVAAVNGTIAPALTTAYLNAGSSVTTASDSAVAVVSTASTTDHAAIQVKTYTVDSLAAPESVTVTVTGPGLVCYTKSSVTTCGKSIVADGLGNSSVGIENFTVRADGTAGTSNIVVKTTTVTFPAKTVTFYAPKAATITTSVNKPAIGIGTTTDVVRAVIADANGTVWGGTAYIYAATAAFAAISGSATTPVACTFVPAFGYHACPTTSTAVGTSHLKVIDASTVALSNVASAETPVKVTAGTPTTVKIAFDKATYAPGEKAIVSVTVLDAAGGILPATGSTARTVANVFATGGITSSTALTGASLTSVDAVIEAATSAALGTTAGAQNYVVYMPMASGDVTLTATGSTGLAAAGRVAVSATATVVNSSVDAATDAANEATDAANAATDAALAAADAADAATAAAQDASDAVAALSASVSKLISSLRAQITSLTNLVIKIQKKVRA